MLRHTALKIGIVICIGMISGAIFGIVMQLSESAHTASVKNSFHLMGAQGDAWTTRLVGKTQYGLFRASMKNEVSLYSLMPMSFYEDSYDTYGARTIIDVLDEDPLCHVQAHNLGRVIYKRTADLVSSLAVCQNKCNQGCLHGVLMEMFNAPFDGSVPSADALTPKQQKQIAHTCSDGRILKYTEIGNCYHAIGHVIASLANNDTEQAVLLCKTTFSTKGPGAIFYCATGVYMQYDLVASAQNLGSVDLACDKSSYPAACYRFQLYHLFRFPLEYRKAVAFCETLNGTMRRGCFNGLGADAYSMVYRNPAFLNQLCGIGDDMDKRMCVEGVFALMNVYQPATSANVCKYYTVGDSAMCRSAAKLKNFSMSFDWSIYTE